MTTLIIWAAFGAVAFGWIEIRHRILSRRDEREHRERMDAIDRGHRERMDAIRARLQDLK